MFKTNTCYFYMFLGGFLGSKMLKTNKHIYKENIWMTAVIITDIRAKECKLASLWLHAFSSCPSVLFFILSTGRGQYMTICLQNAGYTSFKHCCRSNDMTCICHIWSRCECTCVTPNLTVFPSPSSSPAITIVSKELNASVWNKLEMWFHFCQCQWELHALWNVQGYCRQNVKHVLKHHWCWSS